MDPQNIAFYLLILLAGAFFTVATYARYKSFDRVGRRETRRADQARMAEARREMLKRSLEE